MELVENDLSIDQNVIEAVEEALVELLRPVKVGGRIALAEVYKTLGVRYTSYRTGSLDNLILHTLLTWNWRMSAIGHDRSLIVFERRKNATESKSIRLADGGFLLTTTSYPPFRSEKGCSSNANVRAGIFAARKARAQAKETVK